MSGSKKATNAKRTLLYYFNMLAEKTGILLDNDCRVEIEGIIDDIIEATIEKQNTVERNK